MNRRDVLLVILRYQGQNLRSGPLNLLSYQGKRNDDGPAFAPVVPLACRFASRPLPSRCHANSASCSWWTSIASGENAANHGFACPFIRDFLSPPINCTRIDRCIKYFERRATLSRCIDRIYRICLSLWEGHSETRRSWWSISGVVVRVCINNDTFDKPMTTWFANTENYSFRKHQRNRWQNVTAGQARDSRPTFSNYRNGHLIPITIKSYDQFLVQFGYGQLSNDASQTTD